MQPIHAGARLSQDNPLIGFIQIDFPSSFPENADASVAGNSTWRNMLKIASPLTSNESGCTIPIDIR